MLLSLEKHYYGDDIIGSNDNSSAWNLFFIKVSFGYVIKTSSYDIKIALITFLKAKFKYSYIKKMSPKNQNCRFVIKIEAHFFRQHHDNFCVIVSEKNCWILKCISKYILKKKVETFAVVSGSASCNDTLIREKLIRTGSKCRELFWHHMKIFNKQVHEW